MIETTWFEEFPGAITVTDAKGTIIVMNNQSAKQFEDDGGLDLLGKNLLDCHPEPARTKLEAMFNSPRKNVYTIRKNGQNRMIYQTPYYKDGEFAGLVKLGLEIPDDMHHFDR